MESNRPCGGSTTAPGDRASSERFARQPRRPLAATAYIRMGVWRRALARDDPYDGLVQVLQEARMQIRRHRILIHHHRPFHLHVLGTLAILAVLLTSSMATHSQRHGILVAADAPAIEAQAAAGQLDPADSALLRDIAEANLAEIESGQLALERAQSDQIRQFARTMVDNHTQAIKETELFAREKNIRLPSGPGAPGSSGRRDRRARL